MSPRTTPKEAELYARFNQEMESVKKNPNQSIGTCVEDLAEKIPNRTALLFQDSSWTWQSINEESNRIANYFLKLGVKPEDTIALMLENSPEYLFLTTGINKIQGISGCINFNQRRQALIHSFNITEPKFVIVDGTCLPSFNEISAEVSYSNEQIYVINNFGKIPHDFIELSNELNGISNLNPPTTRNSILRQTAYYVFTSGTTGFPKAINQHNYKLFLQAFLLMISFAKITPEDVIYIATPFYHNLSNGIAWPTAFVLGATIALRKRFSASAFWEDIHKYQATATMYIGEIPRYILNQPYSEYEKNHTLRTIVGVGLRKDVWEKFKARFKVEHICEFYGLTEGHRMLMNVGEVPGMIGRKNVSGLMLAKVNPETGEFYKNDKGYLIQCKPGDIGMVLFKLEKGTFFTGYKDKQKTQKRKMHNVFRRDDAYFNTGDMVKLHENKWISFADRFGDTFRWKGENVSTLEVETILDSFPSIHMSAVYGVEIPNTEGKAGMATIQINPSLKFEIDEFSRFVIDVFPSYSIPLFIRITDEIEVAGPLKMKKTKIQKETYDIDIINDPLYFWQSENKKYIPLSTSLYEKIIEGKIKL